MTPHPFPARRGFGSGASCRAAGLLSAIALAAALLALAPLTASAAIPSQFVGMQAWEKPTESELGRLGKAKVRVFRVQVNWKAVEPERPTGCTTTSCSNHSYRWTGYDALFDQAARKGVRLVPVLLGSPRWASPDERWVPTYGKPEYKAWKRQSYYDFAKAAAERYGTRGTFWAGKTYDTSAIRAKHWQIWNEPNLPNYWWNQKDGRKTALEYAQLLKGTSAALKAGNSSAAVLSAGLPWSTHATLNPPTFLQKMFSRSGTAAATNFVAIHPYASTPSLVMEGVRQTRRALNSTSAKSRPIWLTEIGWAQSGPSSTFTVSERYQAKYLRDTYRALLKYRSYYGVQGAVWFNLFNVRRSPDRWYYHTGLFRADRKTPYHSWWALNCVTTGSANFCQYGK